MPKIPVFRDWFEEQFGDLCEQHDEDYYKGYSGLGCKICSDFKFVLGIANRGHPGLAIVVFVAVQMPWVWWKWIRARLSK